MPMRPKKMCVEANCNRYAEPGNCRCADHARAYASRYRQSETRIERTALYSTKEWARVRRAVLDVQPLCVECLANGRYEKAVVVDHIQPHKGDRQLFFDVSNLQSLCKSCHDRKTATEDGGFGHRIRGF